MIQLDRITKANQQSTVMQAVRGVFTYRTVDTIWDATYRELRTNTLATKVVALDEIWSQTK